MRLVIFKDIPSNPFQEQPLLLVLFESIRSGATKQTLSKRSFSSRAAIFSIINYYNQFLFLVRVHMNVAPRSTGNTNSGTENEL